MTTQKKTDLPFWKALKALMDERQISTRKLARLTEIASPDGDGLSYGYIGHVIRGVEKRPQVKTVELIAKALKLDPSYFREYRLHTVSQAAQLKMEEIGYEEILEAIEQISQSKNQP